MAYLLAIHLLAAVVWVGGLFFAYVILRPAAGALEPPERLALWRRVFDGFFPLVGVAVAALIGTGYAMILLGHDGFAGAGLHIHIMQGLGWIMILLYLHVLAAPYRRMRRALDGGDIKSAAGALNQIRHIVRVNVALGVAIIVIASTGRYWG